MGTSQVSSKAILRALPDSAWIRSTIVVTSGLDSSWNTMMSSMRFRNSGRKCCLSSSLTFCFIRS